MRGGLLSKNPGIAKGHEKDVKKDLGRRPRHISIDRRCFRASLGRAINARVCERVYVYRYLR